MNTTRSLHVTIVLFLFAARTICSALSPFNETWPRMDSRDGNSVDTANGAFIQNVKLFSLAEGRRPLEFMLSYNSLLGYTKGPVGYGWSSPYEARITGSPTGTLWVYFNGNIANRYQYTSTGLPYSPLDESNRYDELVRITTGELAGIFKLKRLNGSVYYFLPLATPDPFHGTSFKLAFIQNVTGGTIEVTQGDQGVSQINVGTVGAYFFYRPTGTPLLHYIVHGSDRTFLQYDSNDRLSRIYDPVDLENMGERNGVTPIPEGPGGVLYPITVTATETNRLLRVGETGVTHAKPATLQAFLISPAGRSVPIHVPAYGINLFLDNFMGETHAGTWNLKVVDTVNDGFTGSINGFRIQRSTEPANWIAYAYDGFPYNHLAWSGDRTGQRIFANSYDAQGRVIFQEDGRDDNGAWRFTYATQPNGDLLTTVTGRTPAACPTRYLHDSLNHLKRIENALGGQTLYSYDAQGKRTAMTDARGNVTGFTYNAAGHLATSTAPNGAVTTFGHDVRGNLTSVRDGLNYTTTFRYNDDNLLQGTTNALANGQGLYYLSGGVVGGADNKEGTNAQFPRNAANLTTMVEVSSSGPAHNTEFTYDAAGRVTKITEPGGVLFSTMTYDRRGNIVEKTNQLGQKITTVFDHRGRIISETDARGNVSTMEYDKNGNLTRMTEPLGKVTVTAYDGEDRAISVTGPSGFAARTEYNALGQIVRKIDEMGCATSFSYDAVGNQTQVFGPNGVKLSATAYNNLNVATTQWNALDQVSSFSYDVLGQRTGQTDPRGKTTQFRFDPLGRVDQVTDPLGRTFRKVFAADDVIDKVVDAANRETRFTYTPENQVQTITTSMGAVTRLDYTKRGQISRYTPPSLTRAQEYTYNAAGRLERTRHLSAVPPVSDKVYTYDANGNMTSIGHQTGAAAVVPQITRAYDALNRQTSNTDADGKQVRHVYDAAGRVTQVIHPDNKTVNYTYDAGGRLLTVTDWAGRVTRYAWNVFNKVVSIRFPNNTMRTMQYDVTGRLISRGDFDASGVSIIGYQYSYDRNGFVTCECQNKPSVAYDPPSTSFSYDNDNKLTQKGAFAVSYDADGNVTQGPLGGVSTALTWNASNLLRTAGALTFNYDSEDRLVGWVNGAETVKFTVVEASGGSQILVNESTTGNVTRYVYGVGLAYEEFNGNLRVYHHDERGSTRALSNAAGQVTDTFAYSPYGEEIARTGTSNTIYRHGGLFGVITAPNGLNNMRFRWYSPEMHRFISVDSSLGDIALPASLNRYTYAGNNPVNFNDPDGEFIHVLVGAAVGAVVGATVEMVGSAIQGKPINWNKVGSAALGGLIGGAVSAMGAPMLAGALSSITTDLVDAAVEGRAVDWGQVGIGAVTGAITGKIGNAIGGKLGAKYASYAVKKAATQSVARGAFGQPGIMFLKNPLTRLATKSATEILSTEAIKGALKTPGKVGGRVLSDNVDIQKMILPGSSGDGSGPPARVGKIVQGAVALPGIYIGKGGEYSHSQRYLDALDTADRPAPDTNNRLLAY